jgi:hypothetical protein
MMSAQSGTHTVAGAVALGFKRELHCDRIRWRTDQVVADSLRDEFASLFSDADRGQALTLLKEYGWRPRTGTEYEIG